MRTIPNPSARLFLAASAAVLGATPALADQGRDDPHGHDRSHAVDASGIVVVGHPPTDFGLLASTATIEGDALTLQLRGQVGETLARLPGVSSTSFAPGASRPVLRGFDGDRIRVLTDGIGAIDASSVSADHAVVFDALTVDHIDVIHGPAVLLFGGQAIGGAVNALDKRIPRAIPPAITATVLGTYGSAADERALAAAITAPIGAKLALQLDANWRKSDDLRVGGFVNSDPLRAELLDEAAEHRGEGEPEEAEEYEELAGRTGRVPNSAALSSTFGAGISWIDSGGSLGISVQRYDTRYGLPMRPGGGHGHGEEAHGGGHDHGEEDVTIDLDQTRIDLRGELKLSGAFESLQLRGAWGDYQHIEFEGDEVGTRFSGDGIDARLDLVQRERNGWRGRSGAQVFVRDLEVVGAEAFVPNNRVERYGLFTLQSLRRGAIEIEAAGRFEHVRVKSAPADFDRSFSLWSGAAGLSWTSPNGLKLGANYIRGARAPAPEELLSDGLHVATQGYEIGDPGFRAETSDGFEAYLRYTGDRVSLSLTGYLTNFGNFIAALPTGEEEDGFPVFRYVQQPARFRGFEASASVEAVRWAQGSLRFDAAADYTHARLVGVGPAPRIPPLRLRGGAEVKHGGLHLRGEVEWNAAQNRVAAFENPVPGFTLVNLSADWHPLGEDGPLTLILAADNLFNVNGRRAASYTRDFVPIAGRDIRITARLAF
jgi:iron complex outermembrane recepter protein